MYYSKIQKFLSSLIIFLLLFSITFRVSFFDFKIYAGDDNFYNIVSIIIDEDSYKEVKEEIQRYSKDIQGVLKNTKVVILPTPKNTASFNIASLNEALYYEGYKSINPTIDFKSKLIGTVIVGDFNVPIVFDENNSSKTMLPFIDFEDKVYIYNKENNRYEKNKNNINGLKTEIWHGVISPNFGNFEDNIKGLKDYFDKNHDFYSGTGNFKFSEGILNGKKNIGVPSIHKPYVFYYDQFREIKSLNYNSYYGYKGYLENKEDILYNRFTKKLADKLSENSIGKGEKSIKDLAKNIDTELSSKLVSSLPDTNSTPDIQTRHIINNVTKNFLEVFSKGTMGDFRKDVYNAGRYNGLGGEVNVDLIPYFITVLDLINDEIVKDVNDEIENKIDEIVRNGLSRKIAIPVGINELTNNNYLTINEDGVSGQSGLLCSTKYINFLYGTQVNNITNASQCSIFRGSNDSGGQLVEQNRGYNFLVAEEDGNKFGANLFQCNGGEKALNGYFGGNTPVNINIDKSINGEIVLNSQNYKNAILPLFDINGGKINENNNFINSPLNCYDNNLILSYKEDFSLFNEVASCDTSYSIPVNGQSPVNFVCSADNTSLNFIDNFKEFYSKNQEKADIGLCSDVVEHSSTPNTYKIKISKYKMGAELICELISSKEYNYKFITSYITHKSPTVPEIKAQIKTMVTPNLSIDKNRYIDFIGTKGDYKKIDYPKLFNLKLDNKINLTFDDISKELNKILDEKSKEINNIINLNKPSLLSGIDLKLYGLLKSGTYPNSDINLVEFLKSKGDKTFTVAGEEKTLSYYDTLVFSIYWNNLSTVSSKYAFIFENYLVDQFSEEQQKYFLPKNKKQYEIAYIGAEGDASNMYIKMDPEGKADNPYSSIISQNINLSSLLLGTNIGNKTSNQGNIFKCSPPDGVPITEWIPAVMCWLGEMMPPSITLSDGVCGPSLLSINEQEEINSCNYDVDKNGINDCIESKLKNGVLELSSDSSKYYYNKNALLKAVIKDKNNKKVNIANSTDIYFEVIKIEEILDIKKEFNENNSKIVFDINDEYMSNKNTLSKYVTFKNGKIRSSGGASNYGIGLKDKDINVFIKSYIKINNKDGEESIFMESNILKLEVRGDRLFNTSYKLINDDNNGTVNSSSNSVKVSDKTNIFLADGYNTNINNISNLVKNSGINNEKLIIFIENISKGGVKLKNSYPLKINLFKGEEKINSITINENELKLFKKLFSLQKSGSYSIEIISKEGFKTMKNIELISDKPDSLDIKLGTSIMENNNTISTNFITIYDKYLNPVVGEFLNIEFKINGNSLDFLDNNSNFLNTNTFEGYKIFRLKSNENIGNNEIEVNILNNNGDKIISETKEIRVLKNINLIAENLNEEIKVGGGSYKYKISLKDKNNNIISDFNSRVYMIVDPIFIESNKPYVELKNGIAEIEFKTKTIAGKNINIEFQVEGVNKIIKKEITILPEKAMKIDLILSQNKIEASENSISTLNIELKDRYNNIVFNDNTTNTSLEILDKYRHIIAPNQFNSKVIGGKTSYKLYGTINPGIAYFKIGTNPSLSINSFIIKDENDNITVKGVGENIGKIETFYFWNNSKIKGKKYNSLYTTLLGSNYGDITQKNYLAGNLLFEKENRALAVTSLLNNSSVLSKTLSIGKEGNIYDIYNNNDLSQDIEKTIGFINNKVSVNLYNKSLNIFIGKIFYNFSNDTKLIACELENKNCINEEETSIFLKSTSENYDVYLNNNKLLLRDIYGKNLLEILPDSTINRFGNVDFEINNSNGKNLEINIKTGGKQIALLSFNFIDGKTNISRNENIFNQKINNLKNSILILIKTNSYSAYTDGNIGSKNTIINYNDPFTSEYSLDSFSKNNKYGLENFIKNPGIGWKDGNKSLLAFSSGKSVGESVSDYMSFSVINLGDPVLKLKKIKEKLSGTNIDRKFDSTIGKLISKDNDIESYNVFDYNNDLKSDIILIKNNNYIKLLENKDIEGNFLDKGNLAQIVDLGDKSLLQTGDYTGDGYDDIFFVNNKGKPYLLNNIEKDFTRYSLVENFDLKGRIVRAKSFDMDNDNIDDIVTLDDAGEINIFYGGTNKVNPDFTKITISTDHGIKLKTEIRNDNSLVYFDGLYQPFETVGNYLNNLSLSREINENLFDFNSREKKAAINNKKIDDNIFIKYPYSNEIIDKEYLDVYSYSNELPQTKESKYFIKGEYSKYSGLKVEKLFKDRNDGYISSGDIIDVEIILTNISNETLKNIVYTEKVSEIFKINESSISIPDGVKIKKGFMGYDFLIDSFDLLKNESIKITYEAEVRPIKYSYIDVGLFEKGEVGDDKFGDIILKEDNKNCSESVDIFTSLSIPRTYSKGIKSPTCDDNKIKLPDSLEKNTIDTDGNGIPDYIDKLVNGSSNNDELKEYSENVLNNMNIDSDNDGIPDQEDIFNMNESIVFDLGKSGEKIDKALDKVQNIMNGLSCGFGNASCFASPLNWAPLAPGSDPVFMGNLIGDGLKIDEGIPIVSGLTGIPLYTPSGCIPIPSIWPMSPLALENVCGSMDLGAGGVLGTQSSSNFFRIFVTPTLTGGQGTAICFGGPADVVGKSAPKGLSPLMPGGNCIIIAEKMAGCSGDGSDGDPGSIGLPKYSNNGSFGIINGNCTQKELAEKMLSAKLASEYLNNAKKGPIEEAFEFLPGTFSEKPSGYFSKGDSDISVTLDLGGIKDGNFDDIIQIQQKRVSSFPNWLMGWVTRQVEEIANKLTGFPTIFIILPDFSGIIDSEWGKIVGNNNFTNKDNLLIENDFSNLVNNEGKKQINSGIKEVYEFIGSTPLIKIKPEIINISLPWISQSEIDKTKVQWEDTYVQWNNEIQKAKNDWTHLDDNVYLTVFSNLDNLLSSLRKNIEVIDEYKKIPEKISTLVNKKEDYLEQVLCNVEIISGTLNGWIGKNGDRFKSWVELYILIKATLKSWQLLINVFIGYEEECYECKNERQNNLGEQFSLIDALIPNVPIVKFPKWSDIIMDLHNIRAGINVSLPEFNISNKPILLPQLPKLFLPKAPNINVVLNINLPKIPVLPSIVIPELPDLPTLPTIHLPDLPPPPKLPKMFSEIEVVLDIAKLATKAMCVLKTSPLHPEWRAGDQIAFLTERTGYLGTDFFSLSTPEFSFPFIDAIKVTSYVNLEFETDFIVELARQIAMPLNSFSNDFTNIFNINPGLLNFKNTIPANVDINIDIEADNLGKNTIKEKLKKILAMRVVNNIKYFANFIENGKNDLAGNKEFLQLVNKSLASESITSNPKMDKIRAVWEQVNKTTYSKEDALIKKLKDNNIKKFQVLKDIINTEIIKNKNLKEEVKNIGKGVDITKVSYVNKSNIDFYNKELSIYNENFINSAKNLISGEENYYSKDIKSEGKKLINSLGSLKRYNYSKKDKKLMSFTDINTSNNISPAVNSCQVQSKSEYRYDYKGLYIIEGESSYRLFAYLDELDGNELTTLIDIDNDKDEDLLYFANNQLFIKVNQKNKENKIYVGTNPLVLESGNNKFYNGKVFIESINGAKESGNDSSNINLQFLSPSDKTVNNFRIGLYKIVDKYLNINNFTYRPELIRKEIIDALVGINENTKINEDELYIERNNIAFIENTGNLKGVKLSTKELINIKKDIVLNKTVNILKGTILYSGGEGFNIKYKVGNSDVIKTLNISKYTNIEFKQDIKIFGITGNAYVKGNKTIIYNGVEIRKYFKKPLFTDSKISYIGNKYELRDNTYINILYYDNSELSLDFNKVISWELYDLGEKSSDYFIRFSRKNDYYYSKINSFKNNINSTYSKQILLAPQIDSDIFPPELNIPDIRIPIYQNEEIDITPYIYENSGIKNISKIFIDFNLELDSDNNGNKKDDTDSDNDGYFKNKVNIIISNKDVKIKFGKFDNIFTKKIGITIIDINDNIGYSELDFEIYSPIPKITEYNNGIINGNINQILTDEPINVYRFRGGIIKKIENKDGNDKSLTLNGNYSFTINNKEKGLSLYKNLKEVAYVDEFTGKITIKDLSLNTKVLSSNNINNDLAFPKILLQQSNKNIFYEFIQFKGINKVNLVNDFNGIQKEGIYFMFTNKSFYNYYSIPESLKYNPGALSIYRNTDLNKESLFTIFNDGRINTINSNYKLEYGTFNNYIVFKLIDTHFNREIGRVLLLTNSEYIIK